VPLESNNFDPAATNESVNIRKRNAFAIGNEATAGMDDSIPKSNRAKPSFFLLPLFCDAFLS
jgi:hypothetical protein